MAEEKVQRAVISVGKSPNLLLLREAILQSSGYSVFSTADFAEAVSAVQREHFDVLLVCYSVPNEWRAELIEKFRRHCPGGRVVAITDRPITQCPVDADELVYGIEGPDALMHAVRGKAA
ncbi:MAG TPA: hypothetical protein VJO35_06300 [Terriglobales bacterium]|nr:hypothetical protein [Terriglobales bacterium]